MFSLFDRPTDSDRYPTENGKAVIEIAAKSASHLFDERDPAPFRDKDLDDDAVEYIVDSAKEISLSNLSKIRIYLAEDVSREGCENLKYAVHTFFEYESEKIARKIRSILRLGFRSLGIGLVFLSAAVLVSHSVPDEPTGRGLGYFFMKEGVLLLGWVSMWKPINIFLYEWWPVADILKIYRGLSEIEIEVLPNRQSSDWRAIQSKVQPTRNSKLE